MAPMDTSYINLFSINLRSMASLQIDKVLEFIYRIPRTYIIYKSYQIPHCLQNKFFIWTFILPVESFNFNFLMNLFHSFGNAKFGMFSTKLCVNLLLIDAGSVFLSYLLINRIDWSSYTSCIFNIILLLNSGSV